MPNLQLKLLGQAELITQGSVTALERKTAGLLSYLALEGSSSRQILAGLLWPTSSEKQARTNLRKVLTRLKTYPDLVTGQEQLKLLASVSVDIIHLRENPKAYPDTNNDLLSEHYYDDCIDFSEWLYVWRERLKEERIAFLSLEVNRLESENQFSQALLAARQLLNLEPASEVQYRRVMRLHFLLGDRAAALETYHRCQNVLKQMFGLDPLPETQHLAHQIEQMVLSKPGVFQQTEIPLDILRPPLVGREKAWRMLEQAWQKSHAILITGEAGMGKTRLAQDFLANKGKYIVFEGHLGEKHMPYATLQRTLFKTFKQHNLDELDAWVRRELGRLVPELNEDAANSVAPLDSVNFFRACATAFESIMDHYIAFFNDDLHQWDEASFQIGPYLAQHFSQFTGQDHSLRSVSTYRPNELPESHTNIINRMVEADIATIIQLEPIAENDIRLLTSKLETGFPRRFTRQLYKLSSGNPFLLIESMKHFFEEGQASIDTTTSLSIIQKRLSRLSNKAQYLLWSIALTNGQLNLDLSAAMLEMSALALSPFLHELKQAQILNDEALNHDLLSESISAIIPPAIRTLLHKRAAEFLSEQNTRSLEAAEHWLHAKDLAKAVAQWQEAAQTFNANGLYNEAVFVLERALSHAPENLKVKVELARQYSEVSRYEEAEEHISELLASTENPQLKAQALHVRIDLLCVAGKLAEAEQCFKEAEPLLAYLQDDQISEDFLNSQIYHAFQQGKFDLALELSETLLARFRQREVSAGLPTVLGNIGVFHSNMGNHKEALLYLQEAHDIAETKQYKSQQFMTATNLATTYRRLGQLDKAISLAEKALEAGHFHGYDTVRNNLAELYLLTKRYDDARDLSQELAEQGEQVQDKIYALTRLAQLACINQNPDDGRNYIDKAIVLCKSTEMLEPKARVIIATHKFGSSKQIQRISNWAKKLEPGNLTWELKEELQMLEIL